MPPSRPYPADIRALTGIRFFAAMGVVLFHFRLRVTGGTFLDWPIFANGDLGVDLFFILSGFILTHVYIHSFKEGGFDYRAFVAARLARIYPLHLATLLACIGLGLVSMFLAMPSVYRSDLASPFEVIIEQVFLVHAWGFADGLHLNGPSWSISAEFFAYLAFPAFALAWIRLRRYPKAFLALALALLLAVGEITERVGLPYLTDLTWHGGILRIAPEFLLGMALYRFGETHEVPRAWVFPLLAVSLLAAGALMWSDRLEIGVVMLFGLTILLVAELDRQDRAGWLARAAAVYLGEISYSIYMVHLPLASVMYVGLGRVFGFDDEAAPLWAIAATVVVVLAVAALSYHAIEKPSRKALRRRLSARRRAVTGGAG